MAGLKEVDVAEAKCKAKSTTGAAVWRREGQEATQQAGRIVATPGQIISERASAQRG